MFKNMFENKIGEKLNTFNTSGKSAMEWMGNLTKQIDISDKIQQLNETQLMKNPLTQGVAAAATSLTQNNNQNNPNNLSASPSQIESSSSSTSLSNNTNKTQNNNSKESNSPIETNKKQPNQNPQRQTKIQNGDEQIENDKSNNLKSKSKPQQSQQQNGDEIDYDQKLKQISDEIMNNQAKSNEKNPSTNRNRRNSTSNNNEDNHDFYVNARQLLTRQSTEMTSTFPSKAFHGKINSQTIEIPGLNVKVVRYKNMENDIGKIDPNLYRNYSSSKGTDSSAGISKGKLFFSLRFNEEIQSFSVNIIKAELAAPERNPSGTPSNTGSTLSLNKPSFLSSSMPSSPNLSKIDTYVKIQLLPDKKRKFQTKIQRKTSNPAFDETFYFATPFDELQNKTLYLALYEFGRFLKHELIGAIRIADLHSIKDITTQDVEFTRNLIQLAEDDLELGELTVTLCYLPAAGRLTVTIVKCDNLKSMDINGKSDPYVKVTLVSKGKRLKKKKTSVIKNNLNPIYNESMLFDLLQEQVDEVDMIIKVIDYDRVGQNELIGCVGIGPSFSGIGKDHWYRMVENPRKPMTQSYFLRDANFLREGLPAKLINAMSIDRQENLSMESKNSAEQ